MHTPKFFLASIVVPVVVGLSAFSAFASANAAPNLPQRTPAQVLASIAKARAVTGLAGTIESHSDLGLPSLPGALASAESTSSSSTDLVQVLSALTANQNLRLYTSGPAYRLQVMGSDSEQDAVVNANSIWLWNSSENTAKHLLLEGGAPLPSEAMKATAVPTPDGWRMSCSLT